MIPVPSEEGEGPCNAHDRRGEGKAELDAAQPDIIRIDIRYDAVVHYHTPGGEIFIPREQRERLGIKPHSKVDVRVEGDHLVVRLVGKGRFRGIGGALRCAEDPADYVGRLRREWDDRP
jgi:bifunctional DNA-binding transcriptional regulator/antitoxin component of YhaV-PrlF toxin-antitoxin module